MRAILKKLKFQNFKLFIVIVALFGPLSLSYAQLSSSASVWDVEGNWLIFYEVQDGYYELPMDITSENLNTGSFSGTDNQGYLISGDVSGSAIQFSDPIIGGYGGSFQGQIVAGGTMDGNMSDNNGHGIWYGGFGTLSGQAILETPDSSSTVSLLGISLSCIAIFRRKWETLRPD